MKISSRQLIKEAVTKPAFVESLKVKYETDQDFIVKTQDKNGEEVIDINKDAVILINKFYGYKKLNSVNQASMDYSALIDSLPSTWREAAKEMSEAIADMSEDPTKTALISLGLKEEDIANKEVRDWLEDRYIKNRKKEIHPILEAVNTVKEYVKSKPAVLNKVKDDEGLRKELENLGFKEERLNNPLTLSVNNMISILNQYNHSGKTTVRTLGVEIRDSERVGKVEEWNIWLPQTQETSAKIAGYDEITKDPKTDWCTGRTKGSNLFYHYISRRDIISFLFYIIKDNPIYADDWLSIGFVGRPDIGVASIRPIYGQDGGMTVNRDNVGITEDKFKEIFGNKYNKIFKIIKDKIINLKGENPATKEIDQYAKNLSLFKKELWNKSEEEKDDFASVVLNSDPSEDVKFWAEITKNPQDFLESPEYFLKDLNDNALRKTYLDYAGKRLADTDPSVIISDGSENWAKPYLGDAIKSMCKHYPKYALRYISEDWVKPYVDYIVKKVAEKEPRIILDYKDEPWMQPYLNSTILDLATNDLIENEPEKLLDAYSYAVRDFGSDPPNFEKKYIDLAAKKLFEIDPKCFLWPRNRSKDWAQPYLSDAIRIVIENEPGKILEYIKDDWGKEYINKAAEAAVKKDPYIILDSYINHNNKEVREGVKFWADPYLDSAANSLIESNPRSFLRAYKSRDWAEPYLDDAVKKLIEKEPVIYLKEVADNLLEPLNMSYAIHMGIEQDPGAFLINNPSQILPHYEYSPYQGVYWADRKLDFLGGKSYIDLAKKFLKTQKENEQYDSYVKTEKIRKGSSLVQSKLDLLKSTLNKLGINISFDLI